MKPSTKKKTPTKKLTDEELAAVVAEYEKYEDTDIGKALDCLRIIGEHLGMFG